MNLTTPVRVGNFFSQNNLSQGEIPERAQADKLPPGVGILIVVESCITNSEAGSSPEAGGFFMGSKFNLIENRKVKWGLTLGLCAGLVSVLSFNPENKSQLARLNQLQTIDLAQTAGDPEVASANPPAQPIQPDSPESTLPDILLASEGLTCKPQSYTRSARYRFSGCSSSKPEHTGLCTQEHELAKDTLRNATQACSNIIASIARRNAPPAAVPPVATTPAAPAEFDAALIALEAAKPCRDKDAKDEKLECLTDAAEKLVATLEGNSKITDSKRKEAFDKFWRNDLRRSISDCMGSRGTRASSAFRCERGRYSSQLDEDRIGSCDPETVQTSKEALNELSLKITRSMHEQLLTIESRRPIAELEQASAMYDCGKRTNDFHLQNLGYNNALRIRSRLPWEISSIYGQYNDRLVEQLDYEDSKDRSFGRSFSGTLDRYYGNPTEDFMKTFDDNRGDIATLMNMDRYYQNDLSGSPWSLFQARTSSGLRGISPREILDRYTNFRVEEPSFTPVYRTSESSYRSTDSRSNRGI